MKLTPTQVRKIYQLTNNLSWLDCPSVRIHESDKNQAIIVVESDNWLALLNEGHGVGTGKYRDPVQMYAITRRGKVKDLWNSEQP